MIPVDITEIKELENVSVGTLVRILPSTGMPYPIIIHIKKASVFNKAEKVCPICALYNHCKRLNCFAYCDGYFRADNQEVYFKSVED